MNAFDEVDTLLFDMDGTLTDLWTRYRVPFFRAIFAVCPNLDKKKLFNVFERMLMETLTTSEGRSKVLKARIFLKSRKELGISWKDTFRITKQLISDPMAFREIVPINGVGKLLETLRSRGYNLALVTSAGDKTVEKAKEKLKILESFKVIVTRNTVKRIKPHADGLLYALKKLKKKPNQCVMIGDFPQDIKAGKIAGTKTIAILGENKKYTEEEIRKLEPDATLNSINELLPLLLGSSECPNKRF